MESFLRSFPYAEIDTKLASMPVVDCLCIDISWLMNLFGYDHYKQSMKLIDQIIYEFQPKKCIYFSIDNNYFINTDDESQEFDSTVFEEYFAKRINEDDNWKNISIYYSNQATKNNACTKIIQFLKEKQQQNLNTLVYANEDIIFTSCYYLNLQRIMLLNIIYNDDLFEVNHNRFSCYNLDLISQTLNEYLNIKDQEQRKNIVAILSLSIFDSDLFNFVQTDISDIKLLNENGFYDRNGLIEFIKKATSQSEKYNDAILSNDMCINAVNALNSFVHSILFQTDYNFYIEFEDPESIVAIATYLSYENKYEEMINSLELPQYNELEIDLIHEVAIESAEPNYFPIISNYVLYKVVPDVFSFYLEMLNSEFSELDGEKLINDVVYVNWPCVCPAKVISFNPSPQDFVCGYIKSNKQLFTINVLPMRSINSSNTVFSFAGPEIEFPITNCLRTQSIPDALKRISHVDVKLGSRYPIFSKDGRLGYSQIENGETKYFMSKETIPDVSSNVQTFEKTFQAAQIPDAETIKKLWASEYDENRITVEQIMKSIGNESALLKREMFNTRIEYNELELWRFNKESQKEIILSKLNELLGKEFIVPTEFKEEKLAEEDIITPNTQFERFVPVPGVRVAIAAYNYRIPFGTLGIVIQNIPWADEVIVLPIISSQKIEADFDGCIIVPYGDLYVFQ